LRERADIEGMTVRHTDESLLRYLTQSFRSLRAMLTRAGADFFLVGTDPAALSTASPVTDEQYLEIDWPDGAVSIHGVDIFFGNARWYPLTPVSFATRRDYQRRGGPPQAFAIRTIPSTTPADTLGTGKILIFPLATDGLTHRVWYLPEFPDLSTGTNLVQGFDGDWIEWALWDSTVKIAARDDDAQNVDQIAIRERAVLGERITTNANRVQRAGPVKPRRASGLR
jgi:hypothetical protein